MTNDGDLIQKIMKSENNHEKEYVVKISKPVTREEFETLYRLTYKALYNMETSAKGGK